MKKIAIIGECMVELFDHGNSQCNRGYGGDTLNTAVYMTRDPTSPIEVSYVTAMGDDNLSQEIIEDWKKEGVKIELVSQVSGSVPGLYLIQTDAQGERSFLYWRDQAPAKTMFQTSNVDSIINQIMDFDRIYYSGITLAILQAESRQKLFDTLDRFRKKGGIVAFDVNYRKRLWQDEDAQK